MFESHFGLTAPPFQLNPDPTFYYGSKGHSNALAYLQYGVHQAEGFIVVTGEIGAGKTTLVRTLLEGLDAGQVKAAQIASTQLDAVGLLQAMLTAFGVPAPAGAVSKANLIATLEAFFMTLAVKNKRALLVVDEAQNLSMDAIEELRMLSNFQLRKQALLQSFLIGQPELRTMLESQRLEQLRQRVIASCHLGPLDADETRQYIEHRLKRAGWNDAPSFESPQAFARIHEATLGIPRRINLLCNRLLLSAFLENLKHIGASQVVRIAKELRDEVGQTSVPSPDQATVAMPKARVSASEVAQVRSVPAPVPMPPPVSVVYAPMPTPAPAVLERVARREVADPDATVFCLVDSAASYLKAALLAVALERSVVTYRVVVVACQSPAHLGLMENYAEAVDLPSLEVHLGVVSGSLARCVADGVLRFEALLQEFSPDVVLPLGRSDTVVTCALLAARSAVRLVLVDAGEVPGPAFAASRLNTELLERAANRLYAKTDAGRAALVGRGVPADYVEVVGSLVEDAMVAARSSEMLSHALLTHHGLKDGFVLITSRVGPGQLAPDRLGQVLAMLTRVRGERQMLWLVCGETQSALRSQGLGSALSRSGISLASTPLFSARLGLLQSASGLITSVSDELTEMALSLKKKVFLLGETLGPMDEAAGVVGLPLEATQLEMGAWAGKPTQAPEGLCSVAIVEHLTRWLSGVAR